MQVLRAFQTHYPSFFKNKTEKDKDLLIAEYLRTFGGVEDRVFLVAAGRIARTSPYFPTPEEMAKSVRAVQIEADRKRVDEFYKEQNTKKYAELSDEDCELMMDVWRAFDAEPLDWYKIREDAREELGRREINANI